MKKLLLSFLIAAVLATPLLAQEAAVLRDVEYARAGGRALTLNLTVPQSEKPVPLIVYIHGGGWRSGSKERSPAAAIVRAGYAAASIEYRLSREATFPAQIQDCKAAIRFLRANAARYNIDPERIGVWGSSAGGHLAALLGTSGDVKELEGELGNAGVSSRVQAVCDFCGPANLLSIGKQANREGFDGDATGSVALLLGGAVGEKRDLARLASPVHHVSRDDPPFLIVHGDKDATVPYEQSTELAEALRKAGVPVTLITVPDTGHNVAEGLRNHPRFGLAVMEFFEQHLKRKPAPRAGG